MKRLFWTLTWILLLGAPQIATASSDDGGGRSLFADGAGNRALALGGAYVAVADDASAMIWNPGGLGWIPRRELQATHTNLIGLGFNEQYASLVVPSWRYGVFSLTFRRFGVDGVESRDDRNFILADDLTDTETEFALAYGRSLGSAWSIGGAVKLRRQTLAGYDDAAFGLDLGIQFKPLLAVNSQASNAGNWIMGIAVRNAVEPSIRLDQEAVPDPTGLRLGTAYRHPFGQRHWVLATMDMEKTRGMYTHYHAGLEFGILEVLAMRLGLNRGDLTAGAGITWHDYGFDYLFENHPEESIHRFGISLKFGATVEENRQAYLAAAEKEMQDRLAAEFDRRNQARLEDLRQQARAALTDGDLEAVAEYVAMAKVIDPLNEQILDLEMELLILEATALEQETDYAGAMMILRRVLVIDADEPEALLMMERVRDASDRQAVRSAAIRELLDQAMDDFTAGSLLKAQAGFERVLEMNPEDAEARNMVARTSTAIDERVADLLYQTRILAQAGRIADAESRLVEVKTLDSEDSRLGAATAYVARRQRELVVAAKQHDPGTGVGSSAAAGISQPSPGSPPARLTEQQKQEMVELYSRGMRAMDAGNAEQAVHFFELVWEMDSSYQQVGENLKQHYLTSGMEAFVAGQLHAAVTEWENAVRVAPDDDKAQGYLRRARDQIKRLEKLSS